MSSPLEPPAKAAMSLDEKKKFVVGFYEEFVHGGRLELQSTYLSDTYRQHSALAGDGLDALKTFIQELNIRYPRRQAFVKRAIADGELVVIHSHVILNPGDRGVAAVDIFRLEDDKIVEHWDVIQEIPEGLQHANSMF